MTRTWPDDWEARKAGEGCASCERIGVPEHDWGVRILEGEFADVYMRYVDDPEPGGPLPFDRDRMIQLTRDELHVEADRVRRALF